MKKLLLLALVLITPLHAGKVKDVLEAIPNLDEVIHLTATAQKNLGVLLQASKGLKDGAAKADEVKVELNKQKQWVAGAQTQLTQFRATHTLAQGTVKNLPTISPSLNASLAKQGVLLRKAESILEKVQASIEIIEQNLPALKQQAAMLAADLVKVHRHASIALPKLHKALVTVRTIRDANPLRRKS